MATMQAFGQFSMIDLSHKFLTNCWDICADRRLSREELSNSLISDSKAQSVDACFRKCIARHFEVVSLVNESRELREKEAMQGLPTGTLKPGNRT